MVNNQERTSRMRADVLIVGSGLAGSTLGFLLRKSGKDVLAVELRDANDKDKLCAGAINGEGVSLFDNIYGADAFESLSPLASPRAIYRCLDAQHTASIDYQTLPRKVIDDYCLRRYLCEGGRLVDRASLFGIDVGRHIATFRNLREGSQFEVAYETLVGADGATSAVRRLLSGRNQRVCPSAQGTVPFRGDQFIFDYNPQDQGYCWYIPHKEDATVGCMLHGATGADCRKRLVEFCAAVNIEVPTLRGAFIPEGDDILLRAGEDVWLVGDAAGLIDAFGGGGIWHALVSSRVLAAALTGGTPYELAMEPRIAELALINASLNTKYVKTCLITVILASKERELSEE